jgi:hypothetical protein
MYMGLISKRIQTTDIQSHLACGNTKGATGRVKKTIFMMHVFNYYKT